MKKKKTYIPKKKPSKVVGCGASGHGIVGDSCCGLVVAVVAVVVVVDVCVSHMPSLPKASANSAYGLEPTYVAVCRVCRRVRPTPGHITFSGYVLQILYSLLVKWSLLLFHLPSGLGFNSCLCYFFSFIINKNLELKSTRIRVDLIFLRSEFARNLLGIHSEFTRTRIRSEW